MQPSLNFEDIKSQKNTKQFDLKSEHFLPFNYNGCILKVDD
jgi:hypothetical protein